MTESQSKSELKVEIEKHQRAVKFLLPEYENLNLKIKELQEEIHDHSAQIIGLENRIKNIDGE